jgi:hypothetical protein
MISFLSSFSRLILELTAWLTIILFAGYGYMIGLTGAQHSIAGMSSFLRDDNNVYVQAVFGGVIGLIAGVVFAAFLFGTLAVLYDMRDSLRAIVERLPPKSAAGASIPHAERVEPHL